MPDCVSEIVAKTMRSYYRHDAKGETINSKTGMQTRPKAPGERALRTADFGR